MAEIIGVISSGFAVASLAIQLVDLAQSLHNFWKTVKSSNADIDRIKSHLEILEVVFTCVAGICNEQPDLDCGEEVLRSLALCKTRLETLCNEVRHHKLPMDVTSFRKRCRTLKLTLKEKSIKDVEAQLRGDVMVLMLSLMPFFQWACTIFSGTLALIVLSHINQREIISFSAELKHALPLMEAQYAKSNNLLPVGGQLKPTPAIKLCKRLPLQEGCSCQRRRSRISFSGDLYLILGGFMSLIGISPLRTWRTWLQYPSIYVEYSTHKDELHLNSKSCHLINFKRSLKIAIPRFAYEFQISSMPQSLTWYPLLACNSSIYRFCSEGNFSVVKTLLQQGIVSPFVVNNHGENLLHVSHCNTV
jgi:hypothetical protein